MSSELPPKPPEHEKLSSRGVAIALLGYLKFMFDARQKNDVLLHAPVPLSQKRESRRAPSLYPAETKEVYDLLRRILDTSMESSRISISWITCIGPALGNHPHGEKLLSTLVELLDILTFDKKNPSDVFEFIKRDIKDKSFIDKNGYDSVVRGLNNETLALIDSSSEHSPLYLGMPVRFEKQSSMSDPLIGGPFTGDLTGKGKIFAFHIPTIGPLPDRVVEVVGEHNGEPFHTLLTPNEVFTE